MAKTKHKNTAPRTHASKTKEPAKHNIALTRMARTLYFMIAVFVLSIIIFDSGNLITREAVVDRATLAFVLFVINTGIWFSAYNNRSMLLQNIYTYLLSVVLLVFAGVMTYWERGMASTSTIFFALPLLVIATLRNRHALLAMTALAAGTYSFAAIKYFNDFFNEGFRIQLWGSIALYIGTFFAITWLIMILTDLRHDSK